MPVPGKELEEDEEKEERMWLMEEEVGRSLIRMEHKLFVPWQLQPPRCQQAGRPHNLTHRLMIMSIVLSCDDPSFSGTLSVLSHCPP